MQRYDPLIAPDPVEWLALDEDERLELVRRSHKRPHPPGFDVHLGVHVTVENQVAMGDETPVASVLQRLMAEGLDRHEAVHAIGTAFASLLFDMAKGRGPDADVSARYYAQVQALTAESWRRDFGDEADEAPPKRSAVPSKASASRSRASAGAAPEIVTMRIELIGAERAVWREVDIPISLTLADLHLVIQAAMGWDDEHLWEFREGRQRYGFPSPEDDFLDGPRPRDASRTKLSLLLMRPRRTALVYTYDFGDSWEHRLTFLRRRRGDPAAAYPRFVAGARACPPEDCGGLWGYENIVDILADKSHPEHEEMREIYPNLDPEALDTAAIERRLTRIAQR